MFNKHEISRNACQLYGGQSKCGYDWWWHSFTARHEKTKEMESSHLICWLKQVLGEKMPYSYIDFLDGTI